MTKTRTLLTAVAVGLAVVAAAATFSPAGSFTNSVSIGHGGGHGGGGHGGGGHGGGHGGGNGGPGGVHGPWCR